MKIDLGDDDFDCDHLPCLWLQLQCLQDPGLQVLVRPWICDVWVGNGSWTSQSTNHGGGDDLLQSDIGKKWAKELLTPIIIAFAATLG